MQVTGLRQDHNFGAFQVKTEVKPLEVPEALTEESPVEPIGIETETVVTPAPKEPKAGRPKKK